jgi:hypothetical protein
MYINGYHSPCIWMIRYTSRWEVRLEILKWNGDISIRNIPPLCHHRYIHLHLHLHSTHIHTHTHFKSPPRSFFPQCPRPSVAEIQIPRKHNFVSISKPNLMTGIIQGTNAASSIFSQSEFRRWSSAKTSSILSQLELAEANSFETRKLNRDSPLRKNCGNGLQLSGLLVAWLTRLTILEGSVRGFDPGKGT